MPTIHRNPVIVPQTPATPTGATTSTTATTATSTVTPLIQPNAPLSTPAIGAPSTQTSSAPKMLVDGVAWAVAQQKALPGYRPGPGSIAAPGSNQAFGNGRGYIETEITAMEGGWEISVDVHHNNANDDVNLFTSVRITDPVNDIENWVVIGMPYAGLMEGKDGTDSSGMLITRKKFFLSHDELNAWLAKKAGNKADGTPKLVFQPGDPISIDAKWSVGHESGGRRDQRYGYMLTPPLPQTTKLVGILSPNVPIAKPGGTVKSSAAEKPVDLTIKLPQEIIDKYPKVFTQDAVFVSRREEELKLAPKSFDELKDFTTRLIDLSRMPEAQQAAELEKIFAEKGWKVHLTDRYYKKDASGGYEYWQKGEKVWKVKDGKGERDFDFEGLPKVAGMYDQYQDSIRGPAPLDRNSDEYWQWQSRQDFSVGTQNGAVRFRDGEIKSGEVKPTMGKFNLKPGGGVVDPYSLIATRLEYALDTKPGIAKDAEAMEQMADFLTNGAAPYNPMREFQKIAYGSTGDVVKNNILDNQADRFKFTLEHESGLEVEISCDFIEVTSKTLAIEPPSTKGKSVDQKYAHWQSKIAGFSTKAGDVNKAELVEYSADGKHRIEVSVTCSIDDEGNKSVSETLSVKGLQVEIEMDHVQARTTGPVQAGSATASKQGNEPQTEAELDGFFKTLSDSCTFAGPPTIHNVEDLQDAALYSDPSYLQMRGAGIKLQDWAFPNGVDRTRQKAAYALEMMGQIPSQQVQISAQLLNVKDPWSFDVQVQGYGDQITITGDKVTTGKPFQVQLKMEGFPITLSFQGTETSAQIKDRVEQEIAKFKLWKPVVTTSQGQIYNNNTHKYENVPMFILKLQPK